MASFRGRMRRWREDKPGGLAVIDIPLGLVAELGGAVRCGWPARSTTYLSPEAACLSPAAAFALASAVRHCKPAESLSETK
jgi:hypothetical protein